MRMPAAPSTTATNSSAGEYLVLTPAVQREMAADAASPETQAAKRQGISRHALNRVMKKRGVAVAG